MNFNNQKIILRRFHLNEFPQDRIFVYLKEDFHKKLFNKINNHKFEEFNKLLNSKLNLHTFRSWKGRRHYMPLWFIIDLINIFPELSIEEFEKNMEAYKGPSTSKPIYYPNLPLIEDGRLLKVLSHLLGDGYICGAFGTNLPKGKSHSEYRNFNKDLLDSFEEDLQVFGAINISKDYNHGHVIIPNVIGYILKHFYQIKFDSFSSRLPKRLFELPRELVASFLRAFGDDEGHVYDSSIDYYSNNKELLNDVLTLINKVFLEIKTSSIKANTKTGKNTKYSFTIYNDSQESYLNLIGFDHKQKREDLIFNIKRRKNWNSGFVYKRGKTELKILNILKKENATAKQISRKLIISHSNALFYLNKLKNKGKIEVLRKEHWANVWSIVS